MPFAISDTGINMINKSIGIMLPRIDIICSRIFFTIYKFYVSSL